MQTATAEPNITETLKHRRSRIAAIEVAIKAVSVTTVPLSQLTDMPADAAAPHLAMLYRYVVGAVLSLALARGWLGKALQATGEPYPYPNGNDASSEAIDPKAYEAIGVIELGDSPIKNIKIVRMAIGMVVDEMMADDVFGPLHNGAWGWNCQRRALDHLVEARLLLGEALGAMPSVPSPNAASVE